jgi:hypothetical protein
VFLSHTLTWVLFSSGHKASEPLEDGSGATAAGEGDRGGDSETVSVATDIRSKNWLLDTDIRFKNWVLESRG